MEIIEGYQQDKTPAGNLAYYWHCNTQTKDACQVWTRKLNETNTIAVVLLNIDDEKHGITIEFVKLDMGWNSTTKAKVRDLWEHQDVGYFTGSFATDIQPHANFFAKLSLA